MPKRRMGWPMARCGTLWSTDPFKTGQFPQGTQVSLDAQRSHMLPHAPLAQCDASRAQPGPWWLPTGPEYSLIPVKFPGTLVVAGPVWEVQGQGLPVPTMQ